MNKEKDLATLDPDLKEIQKREKTTTALDPDLKEILLVMAAKKRCDFCDVLNEAIRRGLDANFKIAS
ncbi:MAG: hypothetical protein ACK52I_08950 [Pseudomonadota bacterium]|jgi:hypothetical protein|uniref:hypothetical protein n=1 Tax=Pseudanabaena mucicola TaxID=71190 RepID=UPI002574D73A|nr:hypothetical protein [Pseudanabaena mucicola]